MALFRSLIRIFSGQTSLNGLPLTCGGDLQDETQPATEDPVIDPAHRQALKAVQLTNDYIALNHGELAMFATLFFGVLNPADGLLSFINAGHEPLFVLKAGGGVKAPLSATGPSVGIEPKIDFRIRQAQLAPGDILLGYTDGVTEAVAVDGTFFTKDGLAPLLDKPSATAAELLDRIAESLRVHIGDAEQFDDITLLAIRRIA
jgi:serine phosphatase RsbU (regulator of sigma subunit)